MIKQEKEMIRRIRLEIEIQTITEKLNQFDKDNVYHTYKTELANSNFTVPLTGYYIVSAQISYGTTVASKSYCLSVYVGATETIANCLVDQGINPFSMPQVHDILYLTAGQKVGIWAYNDQGTTNTLSGLSRTNYLSISRIP